LPALSSVPGEPPDEYWNRVVDERCFTHALRLELLRPFSGSHYRWFDFACGYGHPARASQYLGRLGRLD